MPQTFTCEVCATTYQRSNTNVRAHNYCSRKCFADARRGKKLGSYKEREQKACEACGKLFTVGGIGNPPRTQRLCSRECQQGARYRSGGHCKTLTDVDAAYIAGLIDGEGTIGVYAYEYRNSGAAIKVSIANTYYPVLEWVCEVTGVGHVTRRNTKMSDKHKFGGAWQIGAEAAVTFLQQIRPYLRIKPEQADIAIQTHQRLKDPVLKLDKTWQWETVAKMRELNRRGPAKEESDGSA